MKYECVGKEKEKEKEKEEKEKKGKGIRAICWGVFPDVEIEQPVIADEGHCFSVWGVC